MRLWKIMFGATLAAGLAVGCNTSSEPTESKTTTTADAKKTQAPKVDDKKAKDAAAAAAATYNEVQHDGRIYVVSSPEKAQEITKGNHPQLSVTKIGHGPAGETVVFEASPEGGVEKKLMDAYSKKYGK